MEIREINQLVMTPHDKIRWRVAEDWLVKVNEQSIFVPGGFISDLASVPRLPLMFSWAGGKSSKEAVLHDWMYHEGWPQKFSDEVFYHFMVKEGRNKFLRNAMYQAVRRFGWRAYETQRMIARAEGREE